jgi:hypothetical protein
MSWISDLLLALSFLAAGFVSFVPWFKRSCWRCSEAPYLTTLEAFSALLVGHRVLCQRCERRQRAEMLVEKLKNARIAQKEQDHGTFH